MLRMLNSIRKFFGPVMDLSTSAAALRDALAPIDPAALEAAALRLEDQRRAALVTGSDDDVRRISAELDAAWLAHERAVARREALEQQIAEATAREEDVERRARYIAADKQASEVAAAFQRGYGPSAERIVGLLRGLAEANEAVRRANEALPLGARPLPRADVRACGHAAEPREMLSVTPGEGRWCYAANRTAVEAGFVDRIEAAADGQRGVLRTHGGEYLPVLKVPTENVEWLEGQPEIAPPPLWATLALPPARVGEAPYFVPTASAYETEMCKSDPGRLLQALDEQAAARQRQAVDARSVRQRVTETRGREDR